jgi:YD repeat-containing protein
MVLLRAGHNDATACGPAISRDHPEIMRITSNGDGTFAWPASWDDCSKTQEVTVDWSGTSFFEDFLAGLVNAAYFAFVDAPVAFATFGQVRLAETPNGGMLPTSAVSDVDGNGFTDFVFVQKRTAFDDPTLVVAYTPDPGIGAGEWIESDLNGDGHPGFVSIAAGSQPQVRSIAYRAQIPDPLRCFHERTPETCSHYYYRAEKLDPPRDPVTQSFLDPSIRGAWHIVDGLGNGRPSIVFVEGPHLLDLRGHFGTLVATYLPNSSGWSSTATVSTLPESDFDRREIWNVGEIRGDGSQGFLKLGQASGALRLATLLEANDGTWRESDERVAGDLGPLDPSSPVDVYWRFADVNGDDRTDLIHVTPTASGATVTTILNHGTEDWQANSRAIPLGGSDSPSPHWMVGDSNGDGLADLVHIQPADAQGVLSVVTALANGDGTWQTRQPVSIPLSTPSARAFGQWGLEDSNGDGTADLVRVSTGQGSATADVLRAFPSPGQYGADTADLGDAPAYNAWQTADMVGDGTRGLTEVDLTPSGLNVLSSQGPPRADLVSSVSNGIGGTADISFLPATVWRGDQQPACAVPAAVGWEAASVISVRTATTTSATTNSYACPTWDGPQHRLLGWADFTATRAPSPSTDGTSSVTHSHLTPECGEQTEQVRTLSARGERVREVDTAYDQTKDATSTECRPTRVQEIHCGVGCGSTTTTYLYDGYGNRIQQIESESAVDGGHTRSVQTSYNYAPALNLVDLPAVTTIFEGTPQLGAALARTMDCYDGDCNAAPTRGLLTEHQVLDVRTGQVSQSSTYAWDPLGNLVLTRDGNGNTTTTEYDPRHQLFPVQTVNALGATTTTQWDYGLGLPTSTTSFAGVQTHYSYDEFGRLQALAETGKPTINKEYLAFGDPSRQRVLTQVAGSGWSAQRFDGLGRVIIQEANDGSAPGYLNFARTTYADASDRVFTQGNWTSGAALDTDPPSVQPTIATLHYDSQGRLLSNTNSGNLAVSSFSYGAVPDAPPDTISSTDPSGHRKDEVYDLWGRVTQIRQQTSAGLFSENLEYDAADRLVNLRDPSGNVTHRAYTGAGQIAEETDPDRGRTTYSYDLVGNLRSFKRATAPAITFDYDALNRRVRQHVVGTSSSQDAVWTFGGPGQALLSAVSDSSAKGCPGTQSKSITFDVSARPEIISYCVAGRTESVGFAYDADGRVVAVQYPDRKTLLSYDLAGRIKAVGGVVSSVDYDASGQKTSIALQNGVSDNTYYDPSLDLVSADTVTRRGKVLDSQRYSYYPDGRLNTATSDPGPNPESFSYDSVGRLQSVAGQSQQTTH